MSIVSEPGFFGLANIFSKWSGYVKVDGAGLSHDGAFTKTNVVPSLHMYRDALSALKRSGNEFSEQAVFVRKEMYDVYKRS